MFKDLKYQLRKAQTRMKSQINQHRTERSFQIGDRVFLKLQPYRQISITQRWVSSLVLSSLDFLSCWTRLER